MATKKQIAQIMGGAINKAASNALNMKPPTLEDMYEHALGVKLGEATKAQMREEWMKADAKRNAFFKQLENIEPIPIQIAKAIQAAQSGNGSTPSLIAIDRKLNDILNTQKAIREKQSAAGRKGAKAAKDRGGIDSQRAEIYASVKSKIDNGMKTDAAFAEVAQDYRKKPSAIKSNYYREKTAKEKETRGKYNRTGKKRGTYKTISHAKN